MTGAFHVFDRQISPASAECPGSGSPVCAGLSLFHDAAEGRFRWAQTPRRQLDLTVYQFSGSYLSLAADVPQDLRVAMAPGRRLDVRLEAVAARPLTTFLRLNLQQDTETHTVYETVVMDRGVRQARFGLDCMDCPGSGLTGAWLDIVFSEPEFSAVRVDHVAMAIASDADGFLPAAGRADG